MCAVTIYCYHSTVCRQTIYVEYCYLPSHYEVNFLTRGLVGRASLFQMIVCSHRGFAATPIITNRPPPPRLYDKLIRREGCVTDAAIRGERCRQTGGTRTETVSRVLSFEGAPTRGLRGFSLTGSWPTTPPLPPPIKDEILSPTDMASAISLRYRFF